MKNRSKRVVTVLLVLMLALSLALTGCGEAPAKAEAPQEASTLILATTTSTQNSGLLDAIIPSFEEKTGITVKVVAVGTGKALQMGRDGEADALLVHAKTSEEEFVAEGYGVERFDVMYNDFVILGANEDPAELMTKAPNDVKIAYEAIQASEATFVSRGDDSGTHKKEKSIWASADIEPVGDWYLEAGKGMGDVITMANELLAYTMSDRATYLSMSDTLDIGVVVEGDSLLFNQYGVIAVNPEINDIINNEAANEFIAWIVAEETQGMIAEFGKEKFGQSLFVPNAK